MTIIERIENRKAEIKTLEHELSELTNLKEDCLAGKRSVYDAYPNYRNSFYRTPMDWLNYKISARQQSLERMRTDLRELYKEIDWMQIEYYRKLDEDEINNIIHHDGYIIGIKL